MQAYIEYGCPSVYLVRPSRNVISDQTVEPTSPNFDTRMHGKKLSSPVNVEPSLQCPSATVSKSNMPIEYIGKFVRDYLTNGDKYGKYCMAFRLSYLHFRLAF